MTESILQKVWDSQGHVCKLTGIKLDSQHSLYKPSLDRIDPNRGYVCGNIRIVAWIVNKCRMDLSDQEFVEMCKAIADHARTRT